MMRLFKQRWFLILAVSAGTALFIFYVLPKLKKTSKTVANSTTPSTAAEEPKQTLQTRLMGNVTISGN